MQMNCLSEAELSFDMQTHFDMLIFITTITFLSGKAVELQFHPSPPCTEDATSVARIVHGFIIVYRCHVVAVI